ncbi:MAG: hypothetical protein EXR68_03035 [Dehalococcoidia bacterium]|nr:hypothetical protein [Dehalococcoidia bacterium]
MLETPDELSALQALLDQSQSYGRSGVHLGSIVTDERRLNAIQIANYRQGVKQVGVGTVSNRGEPMVAPLDGWFIHGQFVFGTALVEDRPSVLNRVASLFRRRGFNIDSNALRVRYIRRDPVVVLAHVAVDNMGIRDRANPVERGAVGTGLRRGSRRRRTGSSPNDLGEIVLFAVEARVVVAYSPAPAKYS